MRRKSMVSDIFNHDGVVKPSMRDRRINFHTLLKWRRDPFL